MILDELNECFFNEWLNKESWKICKYWHAWSSFQKKKYNLQIESAEDEDVKGYEGNQKSYLISRVSLKLI